jgi:phosphoribosylformylglycinamidine synthase
VSGNVSLYNETKNEDGSSLAILPTPAIGGVGLLENWEKSATIGFKAEGESIFLIGHGEGHLGQSLWLQEIGGRRDGSPPKVDLRVERANAEFVRSLIAAWSVTAVHDISDGGLLVALAEMALAGSIGASATVEVRGPNGFAADAFGEDQGLYLVTTADERALKSAARAAGVDIDFVGTTGGSDLRLRRFDIGEVVTLPLAELRAAHEGFFPKLMGSELTPEF